MSKILFDSDVINVFPSSHRNDEFDRNARFNSEYNITSLVNRLTGRKSFVIDGLHLTENGTTLQKGSFNINGYYFNIKENLDLALGTALANADKVLCLCARTETHAVDTDPSISFIELTSYDWASGTFTLDTPQNNAYKFKGVWLEILDRNTEPSGRVEGIYYLPIAKASATATATAVIWEDIETSRLAYDINQININIADNAGIRDDLSLSKSGNMSLEKFLNTDFIIDDGEI